MRAGLLPAGAEAHAERRGERGIDRVEHRDLDRAPAPGALAVEQRGDDAAVEMHAGEEVAQRRARLHRLAVGKAGDVHDAGHRLHGEVHRRIVAIEALLAVAGALRIDEARVDLVHRLDAEAEPLRHAGREVLHQHVGALDHLDQQVAPLRVLQVERDRALVGVEHRERKRRAADHAAPAQMLAALRLDLDHVGAGLRHQEGRVGAVVDLGEIHNLDPGSG